MPFSLLHTLASSHSSFSSFCFKGSILPDSFPDQFSPFRYFGCDFKNQYKGTLFRFPLRTASLARRSEISRKENTVQDMRRSLQDLVGQLAHHLIFLRHVKTIEIYSCAPGSTPTLIHSAISSTSKREYRNDQSLLNYFEKKNDLPREVFYEKVLSTPEDKLPTQNYKLEVIVNSYTAVTDLKPIETGRMAQIVGEGEIKQNEGDENEREVEGSSGSEMEITPANTVNNDNDTTTLVHTHTPILSPSAPHISHQETVTYLIVSGLMGGEARRVACEERSRHLKLVPLGAVAACISRVGSQSHVRTYMDTSSNGPKGMSSPKAGLAGAVGSCFPPTVGQAFCFLPLPVRTQLPVHVNAYWELSANRRDIWRCAFYLFPSSKIG
jgi:sacsin